VFHDFYQARSDFVVPQLSFDVLAKLAKRYPLVAVTNGNADINRIGLAPYFVGYYRAGEQGTRMKPYPDMINLAAQHLDLPTRNILHIGDNEGSDIQAAHNAGCASLWINPQGRTFKSGVSLPNGEFSDLDDLLQLL
jgi:putative hydrolase of the HAD superfamily